MPDIPKDVQSTDWSLLTAEQTASQLRVDITRGLELDEVEDRQDAHGPNAIVTKEGRGIGHILLAQFSDFMIIVLIVAAIVSGLVGEPQDAIAIVVIIMLNAVIGFVQDYRAEKALEALKKLAAPSAEVRRAGQVETVLASELVPGDVVLLKDGDLVPADIRLVKVAQLQINEAALTGESQPVDKISAPLEESGLALGDRLNMVYKATIVTRGRAEGLVTATGMQTEIGKIATLLSEEETTKTPLQKRLARFGKRLAILILCICTVIFATGLLQGEPVVIMFLTAVSLAVAAIPEALPAVVTISLALGARKMVALKALIRSLPAVETLGSVTYICSDKTGTLTENSMRLESVYCDGELHDVVSKAKTDAWDLLRKALLLNSDVTENQAGGLRGDPTEVAMYEAAQQAGLSKSQLLTSLPRIDELPFDADRKRMTTIHQDGDTFLSFTKGAAENIVSHCDNQLSAQGLQPLDKDAVKQQVEQLARQGYRVLGFAFRNWSKLPRPVSHDTVESDMTFLGLVGLIDPPRPETFDAVKECKSAGITPVMITGDHPATALAIAERLGIANPNKMVLTGVDLEELSDEKFEEIAREVRVYARVTPAQKIKIVKALQDMGEYVAMTGDGVNDAPALKRADIGVAMGQKGTDVAREASQLVLLDDNFATIVTAVREGRRIFDNIRKFIKYTLTSNSGEIWVLFLAPYLGLPIPLLPIHILWINLVTDGLPGLALVVEPGERGLMKRSPRPPNESIFAHGLWQHMVWVGLLIGAVSLIAQAWAFNAGSNTWQTMVFTTLTFAQLAHVMAIRSERESLFSIGVFSNLYLIGAILLTVLLQLATIYLPVLQPIFKTQPLSLTELLICCGLAIVIFVAVEIEKWMVRHWNIYSDKLYVGNTPRILP
ncbi:calcium-translocating P-type ATPase, PMCA-type [Kaarinaea lacus]